MRLSSKKLSKIRGLVLLLSAVLSLSFTGVASADRISYEGEGWEVTLTGYLRQYLSLNLENPIENPGDDKFRFSLVRTAFQPALEGNVGPVSFRLQTRTTREVETAYLGDLEDLGANGGDDLVDDQYNEDEIRDAYIDFKVSKLTNIRIGRQQVAFGETDFFQALDLIHGFDFTWRSFLVPENEDIRKPLNMLNILQQIPAIDSGLQLLIIPGGGLNRDRDFGNTYDLFGGRYANQPNKGVNFLAPAGVPYNRDHSEGDTDDLKGALRLKGLIGSLSYSLAYVRSHNNDPVVNSVFNPFKEAPKNGFAEFILPIIDVVGFTASGYSNWADAIFSTEFAYAIDRPYNVGQNASSCDAPIPGFCGIDELDTASMMVRIDKQADWTQSLLGASRPGFLSIQVFDDWIVDDIRGKDIVDLAGYSAKKNSHSVIVTGILAWNYANDLINPQLAGGYDGTYGGGFIIPSIQFVFGDSIRVRFEASLFFDDGDAKGSTFEDTRDTNVFGYFANNDQLLARFTYQF